MGYIGEVELNLYVFLYLFFNLKTIRQLKLQRVVRDDSPYILLSDGFLYDFVLSH